MVVGEGGEVGNPGTLGMTERRGWLKGRGLLPREKAFVGATGTPSIDSSPFRAKAKKVTGSWDDKGKDNGSLESGCRTEAFFHHLGCAAHDYSQ